MVPFIKPGVYEMEKLFYRKNRAGVGLGATKKLTRHGRLITRQRVPPPRSSPVDEWNSHGSGLRYSGAETDRADATYTQHVAHTNHPTITV